MENFMDKYSTPEQFIRSEVLSNRGTQNIISKQDLFETVVNRPGMTPESYDLCAKMSKAELLDRLVELDGMEAYKQFSCGVSSYSFQLKFGIEHEDVLKMAKAGFIEATGEVRFRKYGKYLYAKTYSPYDYFRLTPEEVHEWLAAHSRKKKKED